MRPGPRLNSVKVVTRFGTMLRMLRLNRDMSQYALAKVAEVDHAHVNNMERIGKIPSRAVTLALADGLNLTPDDRDRLLFVAGYAPVRDFQAILDIAMRRLADMRQGVAS